MELLAALRDTFGDASESGALTWWQVALRGVLVYLGGLALIRIGKSRFLGRASTMDVLGAVLLGSVLARGVVGATPLPATFASCTAIVALHWLGSWLACRSHTIGNLLKGHVRPIVKDGEPLPEQMLKSQISVHDVEEAMRLRANLDSLDRLQAAYKERSGEISVVLRADREPPHSSSS